MKGDSVELVSCECYTPDDILTLQLWQPSSTASLRFFVEDRHAPRFRFNSFIQEDYQIKEYDAELMTRISHGAMVADVLWCKFENDPAELCYADVKI